MHDQFHNRHQRRAERAKARTNDQTRGAMIGRAVDFLAASAATDQTVSGATLMMPSGETIYLSAADARRMRAKGEAPQ